MIPDRSTWGCLDRRRERASMRVVQFTNCEITPSLSILSSGLLGVAPVHLLCPDRTELR
jgi:hypothetical protein